MQIVWFLVIGVFVGWLAGVIMKGGGYGLLGNLVIGVVGALLGGFVFSVLGIAAYGLLGRLAMALAGAILLIVLLRALKRA
jgi:uncharacterized membrane protein YeaQ/YmgE (transglycosylase-associated protein family)